MSSAGSIQHICAEGREKRTVTSLRLDVLEQPHLGHFPLAAHGFFIYAEQRGDFLVSQSDEEPELNDLRLFRILDRQDLQRFVNLENLLILGGRFDGGLMQFESIAASATLEPQFASG